MQGNAFVGGQLGIAVIDQNVDAPETPDNRRAGHSQILTPPRIRGKSFGIGAGCPQSGGLALRRGQIAAANRNTGPLRGKSGTDSLTCFVCAGRDNDCASGEIKFLHLRISSFRYMSYLL
jgi:hypothetical protein